MYELVDEMCASPSSALSGLDRLRIAYVRPREASGVLYAHALTEIRTRNDLRLFPDPFGFLTLRIIVEDFVDAETVV